MLKNKIVLLFSIFICSTTVLKAQVVEYNQIESEQQLVYTNQQLNLKNDLYNSINQQGDLIKVVEISSVDVTTPNVDTINTNIVDIETANTNLVKLNQLLPTININSYFNNNVNLMIYNQLSLEKINKDFDALIYEKNNFVEQKTNEINNLQEKSLQAFSWGFKNIKDYYWTYDSKLGQSQKIDILLKWKKIIQNPMADVSKNNYKLPKGRFMFQVWTPQNIQQRINLQKQLDFIKKDGYIGVVVMWDGESNYTALVEIQKMILSKGFKIWLGFSPLKKDILSKNTFVEPQYYYKGLRQLARYSQAFLMGWRRTSIHLNRQEKGWQNYTMNALRQGNPNIGFIGEAYWGYNHTHPSDEYHFYYNYRNNYNAIMAVNFGFVMVNPNWALNKLKSSIGNDNMQYVCVIQGTNALYLKDYQDKKKRTKSQYRKINQMLEKRFLRAGFNTVIGLAGDGINRNGAQDDMCLSKNHIPSDQKF